ncbi:MAG: hypothetical protein JSW07_02880, partial [bacterium]
MKKLNSLIGLILACALMINCDEEGGGGVIGSLDHEIKTAKATNPEILANGISTTEIVATVSDKSGEVAGGMKVAFHTTFGSIEEFGYTNYSSGQVSIVLTSVASETDLLAEVTATVLDTSQQSLSKGTPFPYTIDLQVPGFDMENQGTSHLKKPNQQLDNTATVYVKFLGVTLSTEIENTVLPADGISESKVRIKLRETTSRKAIENAEVRTGVKYGTITGRTLTNAQGISELYLKSAEQTAEDTLCVDYGNTLSTRNNVSYITPKFELASDRDRVPADGESKIQMIATLITHKNTPIVGAKIEFSASAGIILASATTDNYGQAKVDLIAGKEPDSVVVVVAKFLALSDTTNVAFFATLDNYPNSITLDVEPEFIWVKETGDIDQTTISATVLSVTGQPVGNDIEVIFRIVNGPNGGETIEPSSGSALESSVIPTVEGIAKANIRSGIRSGTMQIRAELVDYPEVAAQTTNIVIRSGPPYMWIDSTDVNNVIQHATLIVECGKHNVAFGNPVQDITITTIFGDKYNNPVEIGTAVYFTTTGGIITTDAITNDKGQAAVILQNCYPFPYLKTEDINQLTACCIPNPNDESVMLDIEIPDFEGGIIDNSMGSKGENDGVTVLLAYTWGQDQNGNSIKVWTPALVV